MVRDVVFIPWAVFRIMITLQVRKIKESTNFKGGGASIRGKFRWVADGGRKNRLIRFAMTREVGYFVIGLPLQSRATPWSVDLEGEPH